jgi:hypothetical protein
MTEGIPRYKDRVLTLTLENSQGTRDERDAIINEVVNQLDGLKWRIVLPDRPEHYLFGRLHVAVDYSDLAHAAVTITGDCEPWFYKTRETVVELFGTGTVVLRNNGRRAVVPVITVPEDGTGTPAPNCFLAYKGQSVSFQQGDHKWPWLVLFPGDSTIEYGVFDLDEPLVITYREAVLR